MQVSSSPPRTSSLFNETDDLQSLIFDALESTGAGKGLHATVGSLRTSGRRKTLSRNKTFDGTTMHTSTGSTVCNSIRIPSRKLRGSTGSSSGGNGEAHSPMAKRTTGSSNSRRGPKSLSPKRGQSMRNLGCGTGLDSHQVIDMLEKMAGADDASADAYLQLLKSGSKNLDDSHGSSANMNGSSKSRRNGQNSPKRMASTRRLQVAA
ncbi:expressed unknown protein [Seminavis robusta]|uniref:Uncharacterized protein n=1 Tax=Seminavis robusta TaxID=568900 RepID=A0A9N8EWV5_9STRA|nr:expressed unknown protein [Seminavis robusta]|eukprot:Sro1932_g306150.1 n/a (207) ;mRNA; f:6082-6702